MGKPRCRVQADLIKSATLAVGYLRRSTDRQEQSLGDQQRAIEQFAKEHGLTLVRFYTDDAISGTSTAKRLAFQQMIAESKVRAPGFRYVICYDVKRFGRVDNDEAGYYRHLLKQAGVEVLYASEGFAGDGTDDLLRPVKQWQARQESKDLAKVSIRGQVSKATAGGRFTNGNGKSGGGHARTDECGATSGGCGGWWMGGAPPFGYDLRYQSQSGEFLFVLRYARDGTKPMFDEKGKLIRTLARGESISVSKRDHAKLVFSEKQRVETVQLIFKMYAEDGIGLRAIADRLNAKKLPTARGPEWAKHYAGLWSLGTVRAILTNPVYSGDMVWNRRTDARFYRIDGEGRAVERKILGSPRRLEPNDERDWLVVPNAHEPIISKRVWELTRERFRARGERNEERKKELASAKPTHTGPTAKFLLSGLCKCSLCGSRYEGNRNWTTVKGKRSPTWSYACGGYIRRGKSTCARGAVPKERLEQIVIEQVLKYFERFEGAEGRVRLTETISELFGGEAEQVAERQTKLQRQAARLDTTMQSLLDSLSPANRELVDRRLTELQAEREKLATQLERLDAQMLAKGEMSHLVAEAHELIEVLEETLRGGEMHERKSALRRCIESVVIERKRHEARINLRRVLLVMGGPQVQAIETVTIPLPELRESTRRGRPSKQASGRDHDQD